jgi:SAM-dependent methyltransferase
MKDVETFTQHNLHLADDGSWIATQPLRIPSGDSDVLLHLEAEADDNAELEIQIIRRHDSGQHPKAFAWLHVHKGKLPRKQILLRLDWLRCENGFSPSGTDILTVRAKSLNKEATKLSLSKLEFVFEQLPAETASQVFITPDLEKIASKTRHRLAANKGELQSSFSKRMFFRDEEIRFEFELSRLDNDSFDQVPMDSIAISLQGWSSWASTRLLWVTPTAFSLRGEAIVDSTTIGRALQGVYGVDQDHISQTYDVTVHVGQTLYSCGQILITTMQRPESLVLNLGAQSDLSPNWIGLDRLPHRKDGIETVLWDFSSGLAFAEDGTLDGITISHALLYVPREAVEKLFRDAYRALKPGAVLRISEDDCRTRSPDDCHYMRFKTEPSEILGLLKGTGFRAEIVGPEKSFSSNPFVKRALHMDLWSEIDARSGKPTGIFFVEGIKPKRHYSIGTTRVRNPLHGLDPSNIIDRRQFAQLPNAAFYELGGLKSSFSADPFLYQKDGQIYLFFEARTEPASIAVCESQDGLTWSDPRICLAPGVHTSFPHVFEVDGSIYMIPENAVDKKVTLYRAVASRRLGARKGSA